MQPAEAAEIIFQAVVQRGLGTFRATPVCAMWQAGQQPVELATYDQLHDAAMCLAVEHGLLQQQCATCGELAPIHHECPATTAGPAH